MIPHRQHGARSHAEAAASARDLLKALSGAIKHISLYSAKHPVSLRAVEQTWKCLHQTHEGKQLAVGLADGRWIVSGMTMGEVSQPTEAFAAMFRDLAMRTVLFDPGVRLFELTAFCKLAAQAAGSAEPLDAAAYFKQAGVQHIRFDASGYSRVAAAAAAAPVSPIPGPDVEAPPAARCSGQSFGVFIKTLVDSAVADPEERGRICGEALNQVKSALARRVSEATAAARLENQAISHELARTEEVLSNMADGKVIVDRDGRVLMMDPVAEEIAGKRLIDVAGKSIQESVTRTGTAVSLAADLAAKASDNHDREMRTTGSQETMAVIRQSTAVVQDEAGRVVGTYSVLPSTTKYENVILMQKDFVSHITHELNAPLASICAALELVSEMASSKLTAQEAHLIDVSLRNSRLLKQLIAEILDFSKLQSGMMTISPGVIPAAGILREAAEALQPWAMSKSLAIEVAGGPGLEGLRLLADHGRIVQILTNLIANSIKSTPAGGRIVLGVKAQPEARRAVFSVKDTGCGIPKEDQAKIFQRFTQGECRKQKREGVGLGLTIVKELVQLHNGTLWLESAPGQGACFFFSLPLI